jgi:hypothetical protein
MRYILLALCALELLFITYWQNLAGPYISPLLFLITSISIGIIFLKTADSPAKATPAKPTLPLKVISASQIILFATLAYFVIKTLKTIWWWDATQDTGIDKSDIIQQIAILVNRFLAGEQPYTIIHFKDYDLFPTYLPFQWIPYIITELAHKDYRWIPAIALLLSSLYFFVRHSRQLLHENIPTVIKLLLPVWPLIAWYTAIMYFNPIFKLSVEGLIAAYYLFVATNIGGRRVLPLAMGVAACLLSRYSIVFWVPLCLAALYIAGQKKKALTVSLTLLAFFVIFYWLPFMRKDPMIFLHGYQYHSVAALREWQNDIQTLHSKFYLMNGLGFTSWALKLIPGDLKQILGVYQLIHLSVCIITVTGLLVYYRLKKASLPLNTFLLFSLKIYMAVFYAFIQIPYKYLYLVPVIISSSLLANAFNSKWNKNQGI